MTATDWTEETLDETAALWAYAASQNPEFKELILREFGWKPPVEAKSD